MECLSLLYNAVSIAEPGSGHAFGCRGDGVLLYPPIHSYPRDKNKLEIGRTG